MKRFVFSLAWAFAIVLASSMASAAVVEHTWDVENFSVERLCKQHVITGVNGVVPGPAIEVREGDTVVIHVNNKSPYNVTIHWHGIFQLLSQWSDGPEYVTQCPIVPGGCYTYNFTITGQEGTLWWHAHSSFLRANVYGAIIIRPRLGHSYPFPKVYQEVPILLGEWWNANVEDLGNNASQGIPPIDSDAFTINGLPGDGYNCSQNQTYRLNVKQGKTYLLRIVNAALNEQHFFKIANHNFIVVAVDASYTMPYKTDVIVIAPGQTVDALITTNQKVGSYYMAFTQYKSSNVQNNPSTTRGVIVYKGASSSSTPIIPNLPNQTDTPIAHKFYSNITGLAGGPHWVPVPLNVDEHMFATFGISLAPCNLPGPSACIPIGGMNVLLSANMNNESFVLPKGREFSMLESFYHNTSGVYTKDFPNQPPFVFNYTDPALVSGPATLSFANKSTKAKTLKFNSIVQVILQNTAILGTENHPIHIHGFNFYVLAQGFGNYNTYIAEPMFNFINPQVRNTIAVPVGGWAVIRFRANNPGIWLVHCHLETHLPWGLAMTFEIENGPTTKLPPPPSDLPKC